MRSCMVMLVSSILLITSVESAQAQFPQYAPAMSAGYPVAAPGYGFHPYAPRHQVMGGYGSGYGGPGYGGSGYGGPGYGGPGYVVPSYPQAGSYYGGGWNNYPNTSYYPGYPGNYPPSAGQGHHHHHHHAPQPQVPNNQSHPWHPGHYLFGI